MIKNLPVVRAVIIHMHPENINTSFGGFTANIFQGVATLITPVHSQWRGHDGTSLYRSSAPQRI